MLATVQLAGGALEMRWESADIIDGQQHAPRLRTVHHFKVAAPAEAVPG